MFKKKKKKESAKEKKKYIIAIKFLLFSLKCCADNYVFPQLALKSNDWKMCNLFSYFIVYYFYSTLYGDLFYYSCSLLPIFVSYTQF